MSVPSVHTIAGPFGVISLCVATSPEVQALSHRALRLYLVLLARHNAKRDGWAWSLTALANDTGIGRKHVPDALQQVAQAGLVEIEPGGGRASTHYRCILPPSLRVVPTVGASTSVQSPRQGLQQSPRRGLVKALEVTPAVPTAGTPVVPTAGTTRQRSYNDETEDPPYPHSEQHRAEPSDPPSPPASRGEQKGSPSGFELPERMRGAKLPPGSRMRHAVKPEPSHELPFEYEPEEPPASLQLPIDLPSTSRGDLVRQLARDIGVRPREARRMLNRQEAIDASPEPAPPLRVRRQHIEELRSMGWLTPEQEAYCQGRIDE